MLSGCAGIGRLQGAPHRSKLLSCHGHRTVADGVTVAKKSAVMPPTPRDVERLRVRLTELTRQQDPQIVVADELGLIVHIDAGLARDIGWNPVDLVGQPLTKIIPPRFRDAHHFGFSRYLVTRRSVVLDRPLAFSVLHHDGRELPAEHVIVAVPTDEGVLFGAVIRAEPP